MIAAVLKKQGCIEIASVSDPIVAADECLIKVGHAAVCSSDIHRTFGGGAYFYPLIPGHEVSGEVLSWGNQVKGFQKGDRVAIYPLIPCHQCDSCKARAYQVCEKYDYYGSRRAGGFAEYMNVKAWNLLRLPDAIPDGAACLIESTSVVVHALNIGLASSSTKANRVAVIGGGWLGQIAVRLLQSKLPSAAVTLFDRNASKLELAKAYAATELVPNDEAWTAISEKYQNFFSHVWDAAGTALSMERSLVLTARTGVLTWLGNLTEELNLDPKLVSQILRKEIQIRGSWNATYDPSGPCDWREAVEWLSNEGYPSLEPLLSDPITLQQLPKTLEILKDKKRLHPSKTQLKVVIRGSA